MQSDITEDFHPRRVLDVMEYEVEEELSLYDPRAEVVHILNPTAAMIWRMCDGSRGVLDISAELAEVYGLTPAVADEDVREALSRFFQAGLLG